MSDEIQIPGKPAPEPPALAEPTHARAPLPPKPDQRAPSVISPVGSDPETDGYSQSGAYLTTAQGVPLPQTDHSLRAGSRGPTLLRDHHLREKVMHFDHERIPERVVHARGAAAHGTFQSYGTATGLTTAAFLAADVTTPVFVRFSTVLGSRGSADTVRDTRGFAVKFYTSEGNFDLVGNNMPVFFIQDGIKFPDIIHAAKPHPDREIPQAQSAHDTFWDFVSLHTEATHHVMWNMSDRGIPRSYRMMEGFGVHTFRLIASDGSTSLVKFHWKPKLGVHSLVWEEAQLLGGLDPDFHRRDLYDAIEAGAYPQWEFGVQVLPDDPSQTFAGIDLLDPTKLIPEELAPVQPIGLLTLDANPTNFFAETEQVAFHTGHLVPGIDATDDPLLSARNFSYLDTQLTRLGGPNFAQIPINRPRVPTNDMHRDGFHQDAVHTGVAPYRPNSLDGGCPFTAGADLGTYLEAPLRLSEATVGREKPASFDDHFSQPRMFWLSLSPVEREHTVAAFTFELAKCYETTIRERMLTVLARVDADLCAAVAEGLGLEAPKPTEPPPPAEPSPALSQLGRTWPATGRTVGIVVDADLDASALAQVQRAREEVAAAGLVPLIVAPRAGLIDRDQTLPAQRSFATARSVEFDALLLAATPPPGPGTRVGLDAKAGAAGAVDGDAIDPRVILLVDEAFRHGKAIAACGRATGALAALGAPTDAPGVSAAEDPATAVRGLVEALGEHRAWARF